MNPSMLLELRDGFDQRTSELGHKFRLDRTGDEWVGILMPISPSDPMLELGSDWREMATLECRRDVIPQIKYGDVIVQVHPFWAKDPDTTANWKMVRREDNPASFTIKFWLVKITESDPQP